MSFVCLLLLPAGFFGGTMASARPCCLCLPSPVVLLLLLLRWPGLLVAAKQVALVEVFLEHQPAVSTLLQGEVVSSRGSKSSETRNEEQEELEGNLVLVRLLNVHL